MINFTYPNWDNVNYCVFSIYRPIHSEKKPHENALCIIPDFTHQVVTIWTSRKQMTNWTIVSCKVNTFMKDNIRYTARSYLVCGIFFPSLLFFLSWVIQKYLYPYRCPINTTYFFKHWNGFKWQNISARSPF